jgi:hypothetical protein
VRGAARARRDQPPIRHRHSRQEQRPEHERYLAAANDDFAGAQAARHGCVPRRQRAVVYDVQPAVLQVSLCAAGGEGLRSE